MSYGAPYPVPQPVNPKETMLRIQTGANKDIADQNALLEMLKMNQQTTTTGTTTTNPVFANPEQSARLIDLMTNAIGTGANNLANLGNFTSSQTYQDALRGMMAGMQPMFDQNIQDLKDQARMAGGGAGLRAGAFNTSLGTTLANNNRYAMEMAGKLVGELMPSYVNANTAAFSQAAPLLNAQKGEQTISSTTTKTENPLAPKLSPLQRKSLQWLGT